MRAKILLILVVGDTMLKELLIL